MVNEGNVLCKNSYVYYRLSLSRTEEPAGACAHDRRALQQLALNVHVEHSDLIRDVICETVYWFHVLQQFSVRYLPGPSNISRNEISCCLYLFSCLYPLKVQARCCVRTPQLFVCLGK